LDAASVGYVVEYGSHEVEEALHNELEVDAGFINGGKDGGHGVYACRSIFIHVLMGFQGSGVQE